MTYVMIVQSANIYTTIDALEEAGFKLVDKSMNRAAFADGDFKLFRQVVRRSTPKSYRRILRIPDPGLGLVLFYPEDGFEPVDLSAKLPDHVVVLRPAAGRYDAHRPIGRGQLILKDGGKRACIRGKKSDFHEVDPSARQDGDMVNFDPSLFEIVAME